MLFDIIDTLENKLKESEDFLKKLSSDILKSMLCIHLDISNKLDLIVDDLSASTSHASDSELDSIAIKHVIVDTTCLDNSKNSCLNNCVKPKSKDTVHKLMISLSLCVIIVERLVTLDQIVFC